jgi:hypothetical protein
MATDNFTDSDGVGLEVHDSNWNSVDATYTVENLEINNNVAEHEGTWDHSGAWYDASSEDSSQILAIAHDHAGKNVSVRMNTNIRGYSLYMGGASGGNWTNVNVGKNGAWLAQLDTGTWSQASNWTLKVTATGTSTVTIEGFVNDSSMGTTEDSSSPLSAGHPGFFQTETNTVANARWDDWTDGAAAGGRTTKNTDAAPLGESAGMSFRM